MELNTSFGLSTTTTEYLQTICNIVNGLPHGSGINGDWHIEIHNKHIIASNFYEPMNENGFYDGICHFTVKFPMVNPSAFKLTINGRVSHYYNRKYQLREYLDDTIASGLI